jgi:hypothetical protein
MLVKQFVDIWPFDRWFLRLVPARRSPALASDVGGAQGALAGPKWSESTSGGSIRGRGSLRLRRRPWSGSGSSRSEAATVLALIAEMRAAHAPG